MLRLEILKKEFITYLNTGFHNLRFIANKKDRDNFGSQTNVLYIVTKMIHHIVY